MKGRQQIPHGSYSRSLGSVNKFGFIVMDDNTGLFGALRQHTHGCASLPVIVLGPAQNSQVETGNTIVYVLGDALPSFRRTV